jgi:PPM family protein phosphatase
MSTECPGCGAELSSDECKECGWIAEAPKLPTPISPETVLNEKYTIIELLNSYRETHVYLGLNPEREKVLLKEAFVQTASELPKEKQGDKKRPTEPSVSQIEDGENNAVVEPVTESTVEGSDSAEDEPQAPEPGASAESEAVDDSRQTEEGVSESAESPSESPGDSTVDEIPIEREQTLTSMGVQDLDQEMAILHKMDYPAIVKVIDSFVQGDRAYLVEQYFEGRSLREAWQDPTATTRARINWLIQLCQALTKVHDANVLYHAIHPDLLRVSTQNRLVLTDFSRAVDLSSVTCPIPGYEYTAPELSHNPEAIDERVDLYSLGGMLYSLLSGKEFDPYSEREELDEATSHLHPSINRFWRKLLSSDPDMRYATAETDDLPPTVILQKELLQLLKQLNKIKLSISAETNVGLMREANEDSLYSQELSFQNDSGSQPMGLFIVADGMGGAVAGEVASLIAIESISDQLVAKMVQQLHDKASLNETILDEIRDSILSANQIILEMVEEKPEYRGMGTTVVAVSIVDDQVYVGHVGDSRLYVIDPDGSIEQKTQDQTIVNRLVELGTITPEEALTHPQRDVLLQAVGTHKSIKPDTFKFTVNVGETLLLCSDGLTKHLGDETIVEVVSKNSDPRQTCQDLINLANAGGGEDNTTVIVVQVLEDRIDINPVNGNS